MDTSSNEILNILKNLSEFFDKNNCEHLQLLIYLIYNYHHIDDTIDEIINQLILKIKNSDKLIEECSCNKNIDVSHPYFSIDKIENCFISDKFKDFYELNIKEPGNDLFHTS